MAMAGCDFPDRAQAAVDVWPKLTLATIYRPIRHGMDTVVAAPYWRQIGGYSLAAEVMVGAYRV